MDATPYQTLCPTTLGCQTPPVRPCVPTDRLLALCHRCALRPPLRLRALSPPSPRGSRAPLDSTYRTRPSSADNRPAESGLSQWTRGRGDSGRPANPPHIPALPHVTVAAVRTRGRQHSVVPVALNITVNSLGADQGMAPSPQHRPVAQQPGLPPTGSGSGDTAIAGLRFRFATPPIGNGGRDDNALGRVCIHRNQIMAQVRWTKPMTAVTVFSQRSAMRRKRLSLLKKHSI